jgi:hypothetical protein
MSGAVRGARTLASVQVRAPRHASEHKHIRMAEPATIQRVELIISVVYFISVSLSKLPPEL